MEFSQYKFEAFNINFMPHKENVGVDALDNATSHLAPLEYFSIDIFSIEIVFKSSVLDKVTNWRVFNEYYQIIEF